MRSAPLESSWLGAGLMPSIRPLAVRAAARSRRLSGVTRILALLAAHLVFMPSADVAASTDPTGSAALGGDWDLEYQAGAIEAGLAVDAAAQGQWPGLLQDSDGDGLLDDMECER